MIKAGGRDEDMDDGPGHDSGGNRQKVTLARVGTVEDGACYCTVPFTARRDGRGDHMREKVKARRRS
jgi:hypothetical protein